MAEDHGWIGTPEGEPIKGKTYRADGWVYRDLPRMAPELFDKFVSITGEDNLVWLSEADYGDAKRGQVLISPEGMKAINAWNGQIQ